MTQRSPTQIRDQLLLQALPDIAFDGWVWEVAERAAIAAGYEKTMAKAVFPGGLADFVAHFSNWTDRQMLEKLGPGERGDLRIRDRIHLAVMTRLEILSPWREAARRALTYWSVPTRSFQAGKIVWRTADCIWVWAGDTATDYNHYTKRTLLSGVITATMLAWHNDQSADLKKTAAFLTRRIDHVMKLGKFLGRAKKTA